MSLLPTIGAVDQDTGFYKGVATTSYRNASTAFLSNEADAPTSAKIMSFGGWIKRQKITSHSSLFSGVISGGGGHVSAFYFNASDQLNVYSYTGSAYTFEYITTRLFRDTSAWYHLWVEINSNTDANAIADRVKIYVNGIRETSFGTETKIADGSPDIRGYATDGAVFTFGHADAGATSNAYYSDWYFIDGSAVSPIDTVGEFKGGVFIPKAYSPTFGDNGFHLKFDQTGIGTASDTTIGADSSDNDRHFASTDGTDVVASDCALPDSPENNFCTLNPLYMSAGTLTEGNLRYDNNAWNEVASTFAFSSGKWYFEVRFDAYDASAQALGVGIREVGRKQIASGSWWHRNTWSNATNGYVYAVNVNGTTEYKITGGSETSIESSAPEITANVVVGIAIDLDSSTTSIKYNVDGGTLFTLFEDMEALTYHPAIDGYQAQATVNFGQDSSFAGQETATSNSDANGNGTFHTAPPSGYLALCTSNLPEPTISPNADTQADDHFNTILYNGDGQTTQNVTGVGFAPDWTWIKERSSTSGHVLADSSRGYDKFLTSNETIAEGTGVLNSRITTGNGGFQTTNSGATNQASQTYVAWNWLAGGLTPSKTYKVVVVSDSGNKYRFRNSANSATFGASAVALDLQEGGTYTFDYSDSTATSHPFRFSTTSDGTHGGGSEYTTGVVKDDTAKTITITVASSAPTLYYYCSSHSGMGGQVNTNATSGQTNFDGSILSVSNANPKAGFSIITWTNTASNNQTIGHGLGASPTFLITKSRTPSGIWAVGTSASSFNWANDYYKWVDTDQRRTDGNGTVFGAVPDDNVFTFGTGIGGNNVTFVSYCFAEVEGYSRFGSYTANGSNDGTFVFTGFDISFLMIKRSSATSAYSSWTIYDNKRKTINSDVGTDSNPLFANKTSQEGIRGNGSLSISGTRTSVDFLSNGFKTRDVADEIGVSNNTYIYMCWAKTPFKYATAK